MCFSLLRHLAISGLCVAWNPLTARDEDQRPGGQLLGVQVVEREGRHRDAAAEQRVTESRNHDQQGHGKERVETADDRVDGQQRGEDVIDVDDQHDQPQPAIKNIP
jgi:hypothetical protein